MIYATLTNLLNDTTNIKDTVKLLILFLNIVQILDLNCVCMFHSKW